MSCSTGKNQYPTKLAAEAALIESHVDRNFPPDQGPQNVYRCEYCGDWHLTSKSPSRNKRLQKMINSGELRLKQQARKWE
ncbi:MAG: hypothetical protein CL670_09865 [Balneola sp.]|mgnify:CR=1|jgi:hypothetical protein|nr:hypothetical protein [Balneola sp.]MBE79449.1 hypothetical protein [Balneola sp.]|tara:strand:- start:2328 stop:2567 length:240 start_codon:yes stop_codon:yes gene_type:complete